MNAAAGRPRQLPRRRMVALLCGFALAFTGVVGRLAQLQLLSPERYVALGQEQRVRPLVLPAARGSIFDRNGNELALSVTQHTVAADPRLVADARAAAQALAPVLGHDAADLQMALSSAAHFTYLARQVPDDVADQVADLELPGVFLLDEPRRFRPAEDLARSVVGSVDIDGKGTAGLELQYDDLLTGTPGELVLERDPAGRTIPAGRHQRVPAVAGEDLVLTIDRGLQYEVERALAAQVEKMGAKGGIVVVMHPGTGEVLALANVGRAADDAPATPSGNNQALTTVFDPGSANKVITMAAALEEGVASPDEVLSVPRVLRVADHDYVDDHAPAMARWSLTDILTRSSNIGTILLAQRLGMERLDGYLRRFGFGAKTALAFPNESPGILAAPDDWSGTSIGSIPIGQGVSVTAMQMLAAYNVIANGGVYVQPKLVLGRVDAEGRRHDTPAAERHRVVAAPTAAAVRDMMVSVVEHGTGRAAAVDGYHVAGKTGTARKPQPGGGYRDAAGNYHYAAVFGGFVPAEDPQLSMLVVIDEPTATIYASGAAAPVFADVAAYALRALRIAPPAQHLTVPEPVADVDVDQPSDVAGGTAAAATSARSPGSTTG